MRFILLFIASLFASSASATNCVNDALYNHIILERMDKTRSAGQNDKLCGDIPKEESEREKILKEMINGKDEDEVAKGIQKARQFISCGIMSHQEKGYESVPVMSYIKTAADNHRGPCVNFWVHQASCVAHKRDVNVPWEPTAYYPNDLNGTCPTLTMTPMSYTIQEPAILPPEPPNPKAPRKPTAVTVPDVTVEKPEGAIKPEKLDKPENTAPASEKPE